MSDLQGVNAGGGAPDMEAVQHCFDLLQAELRGVTHADRLSIAAHLFSLIENGAEREDAMAQARDAYMRFRTRRLTA